MEKKTLAEKIDRNSFLETYVPNCFYWYSAEKAEKVTECGKKALSEMMKQLKFKKKFNYVTK